MTEASDKTRETNSLPFDRSSGETPSPVKFSEHEVQTSYVRGAIPGIGLAGCAYPFCMTSIVLIFGAIYAASLDEIFEGIFFLGFFSFFAGIFGLLIAGFTGLLSITLVIVMNRSLGYPLDARSAAISAGSLAGYAPTVWILFFDGFGRNYTAMAAVGFLGPILAMTLGAIGAAWASNAYGGYDLAIASRRKKSRLSIMNMMIATTWIAVTFAIANVFGGLGFAVAAAGWFFLQAVMLSIIHLYRKLRKRAKND